MGARRRDSGENRQRTQDADPLTRADHGDTPADEKARGETAREVADVRREEWNPGKSADLFQAETVCVTEILGKPENIKPPDRIGQRASEDDAPRVSLLEETQKALGAARRGSGCGVAS